MDLKYNLLERNSSIYVFQGKWEAMGIGMYILQVLYDESKEQ